MQERYLGARQSSNLRLVVDNTGSADVLIAAGWVARASERKAVALAIAGVMSSERMTGANAVAETLAGWLRKRTGSQTQWAMKPTEAFDVAMMVLKWFRRLACPDCDGHGHPAMLNSPVIDDSRDCPSCLGTGRIQIARLVKPEFAEHAKWLSNEVEVIFTMVFGQVKGRMY